jgi:hypothetical protein
VLWELFFFPSPRHFKGVGTTFEGAFLIWSVTFGDRTGAIATKIFFARRYSTLDLPKKYLNRNLIWLSTKRSFLFNRVNVECVGISSEKGVKLLGQIKIGM